MVALSEDEALLSKLFQYRFSEGRGLKGHSFGNLFLTALTNLTGDFVASRETLVGSSRQPRPNLSGDQRQRGPGSRTGKRTIVKGETKIGKSRSRIRRIRLLPRALQAASGNSGRYRRCRPHHAWARFALHQRDSRTCWWKASLRPSGAAAP